MQEESKLDALLSDEERIDFTLSYSRLSDFDRNGPRALIEKTEVDNKGVHMGSIVDEMLFSKDEFSEKYFVSDYDEPTATLGALCRIIISNYDVIPEKEEIFDIIKRNGLWKSVKKEELIEQNFNTDEFWGYLRDRFSGKGKTMITSSERDRAEEIVHILLNHEYSKQIFSAELDHYYQQRFKVQIGKFMFSGIIDIVSVDHKKKIVYFRDLKTGSGPAMEFSTSFVKYRYYLQAAIYKLAFEQVCKDLGLEGYTLAEFEFLYIGLREKIPVVITMTDKWNQAAIEGFMIKSYRYKGLYELIDEVYFHWKNKIYDLPKEVYESNGKVVIKDDFISLT